MTPKLAITTALIEPRPELIARCLVTQMHQCRHKDEHDFLVRMNTAEQNLGVTGSLQWLYEHTTAPLIAFLHSDLEITEQGWDERVLREFDDPKVGLVGFGGGTQHGTDEIYKTPYRLHQLARAGYVSNTIDAEGHGTRFTGARDVAVLDGFALVVRRDLLAKAGGWPVAALPFHCYDYWISITAHKLDYRIRVVGVKCQHHGGSTSTTPVAQEFWLNTLGKTDAQLHEESHRFIYDYGRGFLPWRCG